MWGISKKEKALKNIKGMEEERSLKSHGQMMDIVSGLGGAENINEVGCCATRLRVIVNDGSLVDRKILRNTGATGVLMKRRGVQIIYGTYVDRLKNELESYLCSLKPADEIFPDEIIINDENIMQKLYVPIEGDIIDMGDIPDFAFQTGMLGNGIGIRPQRGELRAPANGKIARIFQTGHAIIIHLANDIVVLLHIGIGTVALEGKGFLVHVKEGQVVRKGELLISFDLDDMIAEGCELTSPMIIMNSNECGRIIIHKKERTTFEDVALTVLFPEPTL